jgi:rhodanese-related sulfurtransferase
MAGYAGDKTAAEAWEILKNDPRAILVDVRTTAEWNFVGVPDLSILAKEITLVSWAVFPDMHVNLDFIKEVAETSEGPEAPIFFLCRSGVRSIAAAKAMTNAGHKASYNILGGFEGDKDVAGHRGVSSGWKAEGLDWIQG